MAAGDTAPVKSSVTIMLESLGLTMRFRAITVDETALEKVEESLGMELRSMDLANTRSSVTHVLTIPKIKQGVGFLVENHGLEATSAHRVLT